MVVRVNRDGINTDSREERIVSSGGGPRGGTATAVGRFPDASTHGPQVGNDATVSGGGWINGNAVNTTFGRDVVVAAGAAGHVLGLRAESGEAGGA